MDHKKLEALAVSIMIGADNCDELGDGAERIVSNIKLIEEFNLETEAETWISDEIGSIRLKDTSFEENVNPTDDNRVILSSSNRVNGNFVVIPRVV